MDLDRVSFPVIVIADDGWVEFLNERDRLSVLSRTAVMRYANRSVVICDSANRVWQVKEIVPSRPLGLVNKVLAQTFWNPKESVSLCLEEIVRDPFATVRDAFRAAVDADDDVLTQFMDSKDVRTLVDDCRSFSDLVNVVEATRTDPD